MCLYTLRFTTGNSERLRIFSNGSVGVGDFSSASLTHAFQALRTSGSTYVSSKNTGGNALFYAEASNGNTAKLELMQAGVGNFTLEVGSTNALMFKDDGTERLRITSTGQLLVGATSSTGAKFIVQQSGSDTNPFGQQTCADNSGIRLHNYSFSVGRYTALSMEVANSTTVQSASIIAQSVASGTSPDISVGTGATISSLGNVTAGIATFAGGVTFKGSNGTLHWRMKPSGVFEPAYNNFFSIGDTYYNVNNVFTKNLVLSEDIIHNLDTNTKIRFPAVDTISMETAGSERLRIASDGTVIFTNKLTNSSSYTTHNANFYGGNTNTGGVRIEVAHNNTTVSGNTAQGSFPHHLNLTNYSGSGSADNRMVTIGFDIPTTSTHANGAIAYQATGAGQGDFSFWTETGNAIYERLRIASDGQVLPGADDAQNLGSSTKRWANIYAADMHFSNEGKTNDVDGTWGDWTLQEGEDSIYMINNRTGKKYSITMKEVN